MGAGRPTNWGHGLEHTNSQRSKEACVASHARPVPPHDPAPRGCTMSGLILDLLNSGAPAWVVVLIVVLAALSFMTSAAARLIRAAHPGQSADAVKMQKNRIEHLQWKADRRDRRRRERAAHRALRRAALQALRSAPAGRETPPHPANPERDSNAQEGGG